MPACLPACLHCGLRTFGSELQAINMRAGLFVGGVRDGVRGLGCRGGFNRIVGEAGCSAWDAHYQIGKAKLADHI